MRKKPANLKYTDLCIYIDKTIYNRDEDNNPISLRELTDEEISKVYNYLYNLILVLAVKSRLFNKKEDYEMFATEQAADMYMRLTYPEQDYTGTAKHFKAIKSVLNYVKGSLPFAAISWRECNFNQIFNDPYDGGQKHQKEPDYVDNQVVGYYEEEKAQAYKELLSELPVYVTKSIDSSIYKKNKLKRHQILLSEYITLCNCLSIPKSKNSQSEIKKRRHILNQLQNREGYIINCVDDPLITNDIIELELKKAFYLIQNEANLIQHDLTPSDQEIYDVIASAFPTYSLKGDID